MPPMVSPEQLRTRLFELEDVGYREFHLKTCPQVEHVIGVRMPDQRKLAKEIIKGDFGSIWMRSSRIITKKF